MTINGEKALRHELERLIRVERPRIISAISEARAHGDLKENAEYHAAKEQQAFNEGRIQEIEGKLAASEVIDVSRVSHAGRVVFGSTVTLVNADNGNKVRYQIVGEDEADIKQLKISYNSPIARALIGKEVGSEVTVNTPSGEIYYEVDDVEYI